MEEVNAIRTAFAGRPHADVGVYSGAGHNFAMPYKDGYHATVAKKSRDRVLRCFRSM
jgi:dienelactone hydrolase